MLYHRCSDLQIPFSNLRLNARVEGGGGGKEKNSRETSIIPSIYLCKGRRRTMALMATWALNRFEAVSTSLTNALRRARSASWSSVATLFSRERRKGGGGKGRFTLHVTQGTVDRNGDRSMKRNGPYGSLVIALPPMVIRWNDFTRSCFINKVYSMVYRMVMLIVR